MRPPFHSPHVAQKFANYPPRIRRRMLALRRLIFSTAAKLNDVGELAETLKWGEPSYAPVKAKIGTAVRIDWKPARPTQLAMYFHCQTNLVDTFRTLFQTELKFEGNRALLFDLDQPPSKDVLALCIAAALRYHRRHQDPIAQQASRGSP